MPVRAPTPRSLRRATPAPVSRRSGACVGDRAHRLSRWRSASRSSPETSRMRPAAPVSATAIQPRERSSAPEASSSTSAPRAAITAPDAERDRVEPHTARARPRLRGALRRGVLVEGSGPVAGVLDARGVAVDHPQLADLDVGVDLEPRGRAGARRGAMVDVEPVVHLTGDLALPGAHVGRAGDADRRGHVDVRLAGPELDLQSWTTRRLPHSRSRRSTSRRPMPRR